jgi:hypothetical protein
MGGWKVAFSGPSETEFTIKFHTKHVDRSFVEQRELITNSRLSNLWSPFNPPIGSSVDQYVVSVIGMDGRQLTKDLE